MLVLWRLLWPFLYTVQKVRENCFRCWGYGRTPSLLRVSSVAYWKHLSGATVCCSVAAKLRANYQTPSSCGFEVTDCSWNLTGVWNEQNWKQVKILMWQWQQRQRQQNRDTVHDRSNSLPFKFITSNPASSSPRQKCENNFKQNKSSVTEIPLCLASTAFTCSYMSTIHSASQTHGPYKTVWFI